MRHQNTFASKLRKLKRKKNECKSKTKQGRRSNGECSTHQDAKVPQEKGTRIGGSTTHLLPEPRANGVQGIERYDTPPPVEEEMTSQMAHYKATLRQLTEVSGDGLRRRQDSRKLNRTIRIGEVVAIRCPDNEDYYRTILIKENPFSKGHQALISNAVYGNTPFGMEEVAQEQVFRRIRELNATTASTALDAFPHGTGKYPQSAGTSLVSNLHKQQLGRK
tara:strand:- start:183 stop:842 length:660 start_codon:yes stop_codon:yes gene_type:complete